ncbi:hypothetical protein QE152_g39883 [Popillia japonica]|uniref:Uncharacterized protein n=1 Tax=Popillia japonica TaxID=7064 RepID=A0AAW1HSW3_POPJA
MMANAPWLMKNTQLRRDLQTEPLRDHLRSLARSTMERALRSSNPLVLEVVVPQDRPPPKATPPHPILSPPLVRPLPTPPQKDLPAVDQQTIPPARAGQPPPQEDRRVKGHQSDSNWRKRIAYMWYHLLLLLE